MNYLLESPRRGDSSKYPQHILFRILNTIWFNFSNNPFHLELRIRSNQIESDFQFKRNSISIFLLDKASGGSNWPGIRWLLHRSPWKPTPVKDIPNDTEKPYERWEDLLRETHQNHLIFKLKPKKVLDGSISTTHYRRARRRRRQTTDNSVSHDHSYLERHKRDVTIRMPERTVETLVVIDKKMLEYHKSKELLQPYVLTIMNIVSKQNYNIFIMLLS